MSLSKRSRAAAMVVAVATIAAAATATNAHADDAPATVVTCEYRFSGWPTGLSAEVRIVNQGPPISGWTVELVFDAPTALASAWLATMSQPDPVTMIAEDLPYNEDIPTDGAVTFGWTATATAHGVPAMTLNGAPC